MSEQKDSVHLTGASGVCTVPGEVRGRGIERLHPVCEASGRSLQAFMNSASKDVSGRAPCPICRKVVKLRKSGLDRWPNTIPHHHMPALAAAAVADISLRNLEEAAPEMLAVLQWMFPEPGMQRNPTDEIYARALAVIAKATGAA